METTYNFLLDLALILLTTKILGLVTRRYNMPQVVGALLAGLLMGPACLNILHETTFIHDAAEIGVVVLMFCAGMETDIDELKKRRKASFVIALAGCSGTSGEAGLPWHISLTSPELSILMREPVRFYRIFLSVLS